MPGKRPSTGLKVALAIFAVTLLVAATRAVAQKEQVLYSFNNKGTDGYNPDAGLIFDGSGNLYGTTHGGGTNGLGTVFELTPTAGGGWTETVLWSFGKGHDGAGPYAGLIFDRAGNLYGTTISGGKSGIGTVFELTPKAGGVWAEKVLHSFGGPDGIAPHGGLIFDGLRQNLYGTTTGGGKHGLGTVFELTPKAGGGWTEKVLHNFGKGNDGAEPDDSLIFDGSGNLYGTTFYGGNKDGGAVFEMTPKAGGGWMEKVLYSFKNNFRDGLDPFAGLILDASGNLYGTTVLGGTTNLGTVFELTPKAGGGWTEKVLHRFGKGNDGAEPYAGLILDAGNLYGTTIFGGKYNGDGTVFELTPKAGGRWTEKVLHNFGNGTDGSSPYAGLIFDASGNLYGTTNSGGAYGEGTVFEITP